MIRSISEKYEVILASKSPRRHELLKKLIPDFKIHVVPVEENYSNNLKKEQIAEYLSELKSSAYLPKDNQLILLAREAAQQLLKEDPDLTNPKNSMVRNELIRQMKLKPNWSRIS